MIDNTTSTIEGSEEAVNERVTRLVSALASEISPGRILSEPLLDRSLEVDFGFDSLTRMELVHRIELEFGVAIPDRVIGNAETPRDLVRALSSAGEAIQIGMDVELLAPNEAAGRPIPHAATTLTEVLEFHAVNNADHVHVRIYGDDGTVEPITYGELWQGARRVAAGLIDHDVQPDEAILIMLPTGRDYFMTFAGVLLAGAVPVPVYPPGRAAQIEDHMQRHIKIAVTARAGLMVTVPEGKPFSRLMAAGVGTLRAVVTTAELSRECTIETWPSRTPQDTAFLQFTSGSTGDPKGVILSHANLMANVRAMGQALEVGPEDVLVSWLPLYHDMGLIGAWFGPLYYAVPLVIMSPLTFLARPERWLQAIHRYKGTISGAPNFAYEACISRIPDAALEGLDLSSWRVAFNGAEAVSPKTLDGFYSRFAESGFRREAMMPVYGLAENCVGLAFPPLDRGPNIDHIDRDTLMSKGIAEPISPDDPRAIALPGCGFPIPGHQIRLVDASGREVPDRVQARIEFQGPSATSGYFRNAEATATLFDGEWLDSKDLGYTVDGELFITGRVKDMIIRGGRNIFPVELEEAVGNLDGIQQGGVAAFGSADPETGTERLVVMAEFRRRDPNAQEKIRSTISELSVDQIGMPPDVIMLVPPRSVPKTSSGKIRRQAAKILFETGHAGEKPTNLRWQLIRMGLRGILPRLNRYLRIAADKSFGIYAWCVLLAVAPIAWVLVSVAPSPSLSWRIARTAVRMMQGLTRLRVEVEGLENIPPDGPVILAANHSSYLDGVALMASLPDRYRFVAKSELIGNFVSRIFMRRLGTLFVERFATKQSLADADRVTITIQNGGRVIYFPEGTFSRMPGLLPFQMGTFIAAAKSGASIIPIAIRGTRHILREKSVLPRRGLIRLVIGSPISSSIEKDEAGQWSEAVRLRDETRTALLMQTGEPDLGHERVVPAGAPPRPE